MEQVKLILVVIFVGLVLSCAPRAIPAEKTLAGEGLKKETKAAALQGWEAKWQDVLNNAKKERSLIIHTGISPDTRTFVTKAFTSKFNIDIEWIAGRGGDTANRIMSERRANIFNADLIMTGTTTLLTVLKPNRIFQPIVSEFILPEVTDTKFWYENRYQFADKDQNVLYLSMGPSNAIYANSNLVRKEEFTSYKYVLDPRWKRKISLGDPIMPGGGNFAFSVILVGLGEGFLREVAKQNPVIVRDDRLRADWLAQGKQAISIGGMTIARDMERVGAPIFQPDMRELAALTQGFGALTLLKNAPHPNASRLFINWILTREGQEIFNRYNDKQSIRLDVGTDWLSPGDIRQEGVKYYRAGDEDFVNRKEEFTKMAEDIFGHLMK